MAKKENLSISPDYVPVEESTKAYEAATSVSPEVATEKISTRERGAEVKARAMEKINSAGASFKNLGSKMFNGLKRIGKDGIDWGIGAVAKTGEAIGDTAMWGGEKIQKGIDKAYDFELGDKIGAGFEMAGNVAKGGLDLGIGAVVVGVEGIGKGVNWTDKKITGGGQWTLEKYNSLEITAAQGVESIKNRAIAAKEELNQKALAVGQWANETVGNFREYRKQKKLLMMEKIIASLALLTSKVEARKQQLEQIKNEISGYRNLSESLDNYAGFDFQETQAA